METNLTTLSKQADELQAKIDKKNAIADKNIDSINMTEGVQKSLKKYLLHSADGVNTNYETYLENFMQTAMEDPNSKAGQILAQALIHPDMLSQLDESVNNAISKDRDFMNYRIIKTLFDKQRDVYLDSLVRRKAIMCSRRAGKTELAVRQIVSAAVNESTPILYINLSFDNAVAQVFDKVIELSEAINLPIDSSSKANGEIIYNNGSSVKFKGNSNKTEREKLRGFNYRLVIVDEAQSQSGLQYLLDDIISPLLMDYSDSILVVQGTPPRTSKTYWEKLYMEWGNGKDPKSKSYHWDMTVNPYIENAEEEIENICKRKGINKEDSFIQREFYGRIVYDIEAQVFKGYQTYENVPDTFIPTNAILGIDWGYEDNNAFIGLVYNTKTKEGYVINEERYNHGTTSKLIKSSVDDYNDLLKWCKDRNRNFDKGNVLIIGDNSDKAEISELYETYNLPAYPCYKYDKQAAISLLGDLLRTGTIKVPKDGICCDEFDQTVYKRNDEGYIVNEIDDSAYHPNAVFALLYATRQYLFEIGNPLGGISKEQETNWKSEINQSEVQTIDDNEILFGKHNSEDIVLENAVTWDNSD